MSINKGYVVNMITEDFSHQPAVKSACLNLAEHLYEHAHNIDRISLAEMMCICEANDVKTVLDVIKYCSEGIGLIQVFGTIVADNDVFELTSDEVNATIRAGMLMHPKKGIRVQYEEISYPYFAPGHALQGRSMEI